MSVKKIIPFYCFITLLSFITADFMNGFNQAYNIDPSLMKIVEDSQLQIRKSYWYYLRNSRGIYSTIFDSPQHLFIFFIHRNIYGTFQTVAQYNKIQQKHYIKNLVRLGNGASADIPLQSEIELSPYILSIQLKPQQYLVVQNQQGKYEIISGKQQQQNPIPLIHNITSRQPQINKNILNQYSHYLQNISYPLHTETILTTHHIYFLLTYMSQSGLYLAIGSQDVSGYLSINTFVRLSQGRLKQNTSSSPKIKINAKVIQLH